MSKRKTQEPRDLLKVALRDEPKVVQKVRAEGRVEGRVEGRDDERTAVALDMLADNEPIEKIVKYSHLPESKILELRDSRATYSSK